MNIRTIFCLSLMLMTSAAQADAVPAAFQGTWVEARDQCKNAGQADNTIIITKNAYRQLDSSCTLKHVVRASKSRFTAKWACAEPGDDTTSIWSLNLSRQGKRMTFDAPGALAYQYCGAAKPDLI